jgi:hypothetical protein
MDVCLSSIAFVLCFISFVFTLMVARELKNGPTIHFLTGAMAYATIIRFLLMLTALKLIEIPTLWFGPPTYLLLALGFWSLYRGLRKLKK